MLQATIGVLVLTGIVFFFAVLSARNTSRKTQAPGGTSQPIENKAKNESEELDRNKANPGAMEMAAGGHKN